MNNFSIIQKSQLEGAARIDAEYYQPEYLEFAKRLINVGEIPLGNVAFITDGQHGYHIVDPNSEIRHITAKNVLEWLVNDNDADRLSIKTHNANKRSNLEVADLLLSTAGTIGAVGIVQEDILPANIDQDVARIHVLDSRKIDPYFLIAFLNSKYGQLQLIRETTGQIQTHVSLDKIKNRIFVPIPNWQGKISNLVKTALDDLSKSKSMYFEAENLLLEELGLRTFKIEDDLSFIVNFSDIKKANRIDAEYFQPKYREIIEKIEKYEGGWDVLEKAVRFKDNNFTPREDEKYKYLALSNISNQGYVQDYQEELGKNLPSRARRKINTGDVIISSIEGSSSSCAIIEEEFDNAICSTGFFVLHSKKINPETLLILFKSNFIQELLQRGSKGTILTAISKTELEYIKIPLIKLYVQKQIAEMVRKSHEARKKSKELLEEAKRKVEEMIEKGAK